MLDWPIQFAQKALKKKKKITFTLPPRPGGQGGSERQVG